MVDRGLELGQRDDAFEQGCAVLVGYVDWEVAEVGEVHPQTLACQGAEGEAVGG